MSALLIVSTTIKLMVVALSAELKVFFIAKFIGDAITEPIFINLLYFIPYTNLVFVFRKFRKFLSFQWIFQAMTFLNQSPIRM